MLKQGKLLPFFNILNLKINFQEKAGTNNPTKRIKCQILVQ